MAAPSANAPRHTNSDPRVLTNGNETEHWRSLASADHRHDFAALAVIDSIKISALHIPQSPVAAATPACTETPCSPAHGSSPAAPAAGWACGPCGRCASARKRSTRRPNDRDTVALQQVLRRVRRRASPARSRSTRPRSSRSIRTFRLLGEGQAQPLQRGNLGLFTLFAGSALLVNKAIRKARNAVAPPSGSSRGAWPFWP